MFEMRNNSIKINPYINYKKYEAHVIHFVNYVSTKRRKEICLYKHYIMDILKSQFQENNNAFVPKHIRDATL